MIDTIRELLKPVEKRPLDLAKIRVAGVQISALANSHLRVMEELNKVYEEMAEVLKHTDPTSEEGKEFEELFIAMNRVFVRFAGTHHFIALGQAFQEFRRESAAAPALRAVLSIEEHSTESKPAATTGLVQHA